MKPSYEHHSDHNKQNISLDRLNYISHILNQEASAITLVANNVPSEVENLIDKIINTDKHIFFSGIGKSGIISKKLAATFSSLGIPSFYIHPIEALHGDIGMITKNSIVIILSKSGTGLDISEFIQALKSKNIFVSLICCNLGNLASLADLVIKIPLQSEAGELGLAPTNSSSAMLALGDAIALTISKERGLTKKDFALLHPSGALGKNLLLNVSSIMYKEDKLPLINPNTSFQDTILTITSKKLGIGIVVDNNKKLLGVITDGDLRRGCQEGASIFNKKAFQIMTINPKVISSDLSAQKALEIMESFNITSLIVEDNGIVTGLIHIHDLIKLGIIKGK